MGRKITNRPVVRTYAVIGDGETEYIYIDSIKKEFKTSLKDYKLQPELPKHSNVLELEKLILRCLNKELCDKVFCIIDMDTKLRDSKEMQKYQKLKAQYARNPNVKFYETHPCTELWFYYYFKETTKPLYNYEPNTKALIRTKIPSYEKKAPHCTHQHICKCGGDINLAICNARKSIASMVHSPRSYTYSQMASFFDDINLTK